MATIYEDDFVFSAMRADARAYLCKLNDGLLEVVRRHMNGGAS